MLYDGPVTVGDYVAIVPPAPLAAFMAERHYLPLGLPLIKRVAAQSGAVICRHEAAVSINGKPVAQAAERDHLGRALPVWSGCRALRPGELFVINGPQDSFDSRYFGPLGATQLLGKAVPLVTRDAPTAPLAWRRFSTRRSAQPLPEG
ncbi:hypothetical protein NVSP9465_01468 [Novosphingobium sp. CECT 9465]|nr:hypothetical protein NVSP9465_01468 [Novosphingobium sp. CECT 9465]